MLAVSWDVSVTLPVAAHPAVGVLVLGSHGGSEVPTAAGDESLVPSAFLSVHQVF